MRRRPPDGVLLIDKAGGRTSHDVVKQVKRALGGGRKTKVGHAGTLDPFATGLLIVLVGEGTKVSRFLMSQDKVYRGTIRLGVETDTLDPTGRVTRECAVPHLTEADIKERAKVLEGDIEQVPPAFSAVKCGGTPAYKLARKGVPVHLGKKRVTIHSFKIEEVRLPDVLVRVTCSSGTYIRSLAEEFGRILGSGAHLASLRRLASGSCRVEHALDSHELRGNHGPPDLEARVIPLVEALSGMHEIQVQEPVAEKIRCGYQPRWGDLLPDREEAASAGGYIKVVSKGQLVAIVSLTKKKGVGHDRVKGKVERVFLRRNEG